MEPEQLGGRGGAGPTGARGSPEQSKAESLPNGRAGEGRPADPGGNRRRRPEGPNYPEPLTGGKAGRGAGRKRGEGGQQQPRPPQWALLRQRDADTEWRRPLHSIYHWPGADARANGLGGDDSPTGCSCGGIGRRMACPEWDAGPDQWPPPSFGQG